jgi:hexosaminidase
VSIFRWPPIRSRFAFGRLPGSSQSSQDVGGWRLDIKKYPRLTEVGVWADLGEGIKLGGFYTQEDIREIVAYANDRFIMVVPEIETPSHSGAVMVAYPELNCFGTRKTIAQFPIDPLCGSEYCPGNDKVFEFLDGVFTEVAQVFPGPYIHVGGDEAEMRYWGECPKCQKYARAG